MNPSEDLVEYLSRIKEFEQSLTILNRINTGKFWLIGGMVYRGIASQWYGVPPPAIDLDFIVEKINDGITLPEGFSVQKNRFGNPKVIGPGLSIDVVPLDNIRAITARKLSPTIDNYLSGVPLDVQYIAFDVGERKVIGDVGINALVNREVSVYNIDFALYRCSQLGISLKEMIDKKAAELNFKPIYPN